MRRGQVGRKCGLETWRFSCHCQDSETKQASDVDISHVLQQEGLEIKVMIQVEGLIVFFYILNLNLLVKVCESQSACYEIFLSTKVYQLWILLPIPEVSSDPQIAAEVLIFHNHHLLWGLVIWMLDSRMVNYLWMIPILEF